MKEAVAFAPGHISGFFQPIVDDTDFRKTGSRGAGVNIKHGATAHVSISPSNVQKILLLVNDQKGKYPVTKTAVQHIVGTENLNVEVNITLDLPVSQGFGMSAASALSACLATGSCLGKTRLQSIEAAHYAEVSHHTGLGDVYTSATGGFEIREKPGIPPFGKINKITSQKEIILILFPGIISTHDLLTDKEQMEKISTIGSYCAEKVFTDPTVESIMKYSYYFTKESKLASKSMLKELEQINKVAPASMCMLGHALFSLANEKEIKRMIKSKVKLISTSVDNQGARVLKTC